MHKLFYILNFTWGIIMNLVGAVVALVLTAMGYKPTRHAGSIVFKYGHGWGGVSLGVFSVVCEEASTHTLNHEFGHAIQNAWYGPFHVFISIASALRYWAIRLKLITVTNYDDAWFEGQATKLGDKYVQEW